MVVFAHCYKIISHAIDILAALEDSFGKLAMRQTILVYLIGANGAEMANLSLSEEILHLMPPLQTLKIILIGSECIDAAEQIAKHEQTLGSCLVRSLSWRWRNWIRESPSCQNSTSGKASFPFRRWMAHTVTLGEAGSQARKQGRAQYRRIWAEPCSMRNSAKFRGAEW